MQNRPIQYAGFRLRLGAAVLDAVAFYVVEVLTCAIINLLFEVSQVGQGSHAADAFSDFLCFITGLIVLWLYFAMQESSRYQATLGKRAMKILVTDLDGNRISFMQASGRYFAKVLSTVAVMAGHAMIAVTEKKQGLHDLLAGTLVIKPASNDSSTFEA